MVPNAPQAGTPPLRDWAWSRTATRTRRRCCRSSSAGFATRVGGRLTPRAVHCEEVLMLHKLKVPAATAPEPALGIKRVWFAATVDTDFRQGASWLGHRCAASAYLELQQMVPFYWPSSLDRTVQNNVCGPDVTSNLGRILRNVEETFGAADSGTQCKACRALQDLSSGTAAVAWDILPLANTPTGGKYPFFFASQDSFTDTTGAIGNKCFAKGAINYALFGRAQRLCWEKNAGTVDQSRYSLSSTLSLIAIYRWRDLSGPTFGFLLNNT